MTPTAEPAQSNHRATYREVLAEPRFRLLFSTRTVAITADALPTARSTAAWSRRWQTLRRPLSWTTGRYPAPTSAP